MRIHTKQKFSEEKVNKGQKGWVWDDFGGVWKFSCSYGFWCGEGSTNCCSFFFWVFSWSWRLVILAFFLLGILSGTNFVCVRPVGSVLGKGVFGSSVPWGSLLVVFVYVMLWCVVSRYDSRSSDLRFSRDYPSEDALDSFLLSPVPRPSLIWPTFFWRLLVELFLWQGSPPPS